MARIAAGLYTLRDADEALPAVIERVGEYVRGVEFAFRVEEADPAEVAAALSRSGLSVTGAHVGPRFREHFDAHVARYRALGCPALVLSRLPDDCLGSAAAIEDGVERLRDDAALVGGAGFDFLYHNHDREFERHDGRLAFDRLVAGTEEAGVGFVLDVGWVAAAGADPVAVIERYGDRIPQLHIADVNASGEQVALGDGVVDVPGCVRAAGEAGVEWLIYEHDQPADPFRTLADAAGRLRELATA
ncbi:MAG: sugar phosphate isomerase/epimerase family protein [Halobacteriaceae archaeon]